MTDTATATLEFSAPNSVTIDWGDGTTQRHLAAPDGVTLTHTYATDGRFSITVQDLVTFQRARKRFRCPSCHMTDANFTLSFPPEGTGATGKLNWSTNVTGAIGTTPITGVRFMFPDGGYSTYSAGSQAGQWSVTWPGWTMGPWRMTVFAYEDPECLATVSGGNGPRPDTFIITPELYDWENSCSTSPTGHDLLQLRGHPDPGPWNAWNFATWTVNWGDGTIERGRTITYNDPLTHEYSLPQGQQHTITVTNEQNNARRNYTFDCAGPWPEYGQQWMGWMPSGSRTPPDAASANDHGVTGNPATNWLPGINGAFQTLGVGPNEAVRVAWDGSQWQTLASGATAGSPGTWTPAGTLPWRRGPLTSNAAQVAASPSTAWSAGQYVVSYDNLNLTWNGSGWVNVP